MSSETEPKKKPMSKKRARALIVDKLQAITTTLPATWIDWGYARTVRFKECVIECQRIAALQRPTLPKLIQQAEEVCDFYGCERSDLVPEGF